LLVLWGIWLLTTGVFFSIALFYHTYYLVMIAPAIAALGGIAVVSLWAEYRSAGSRLWLLCPASLVAVAGVQIHILQPYPTWSRWLDPRGMRAQSAGRIAID
jgi:4-amino-4-deoxy-L-arabinose transferase-like glycosyltransferase